MERRRSERSSVIDERAVRRSFLASRSSGEGGLVGEARVEIRR